MKSVFFFCCIAMITSTLSAQVQNNSSVQLAFEHMVRNEVLEFEKAYVNDHGEKFTVKTFKYYVSNVSLEDDSGKIHLASSEIFLIDEANPESKRLAFSIPTGKYKNIRFTIGVDSTHSSDGVHEGSLDPYLGMFWTWNTGFVAAKLEGNSPASTMPQKLFEYHIGGFRTGQNALRTIVIPFAEITGFDNKAKTLITLKADITKWFNAKYRLPIAKQSFVHSPGETALKYADNYATMFSLINLKRY